MRNYVGPLLDSLNEDEISESVPECDGSWMHSAARAEAITAICLGKQVRLTRLRMSPTNEEIPGEIQGRVYGSSHQAGGRIHLAMELDDGECVGVDVSNPRDWSWDVGCG